MGSHDTLVKQESVKNVQNWMAEIRNKYAEYLHLKLLNCSWLNVV